MSATVSPGELLVGATGRRGTRRAARRASRGRRRRRARSARSPASCRRRSCRAKVVAGDWSVLALVLLAVISFAGWLLARQRLAPHRRSRRRAARGGDGRVDRARHRRVACFGNKPVRARVLRPGAPCLVVAAAGEVGASAARVLLLVVGLAGPLLIVLSLAIRFGLGFDAPWYLLELVSLGYVHVPAVAITLAGAACAAQLAAVTANRYAPYPARDERPRFGPFRELVRALVLSARARRRITEERPWSAVSDAHLRDPSDRRGRAHARVGGRRVAVAGPVHRDLHARAAEPARAQLRAARACLPPAPGARRSRRRGTPDRNRGARVPQLAPHRRPRRPACKIGRIGLKMVVVQGTDHETLKKGPGHYTPSGVPGEGHLIYVAGHRTTYLAPFAHINDIKVGDYITFSVPYATFTYRVQRHYIVRRTSCPCSATTARRSCGCRRVTRASSRRTATSSTRPLGRSATRRRRGERPARCRSASTSAAS